MDAFFVFRFVADLRTVVDLPDTEVFVAVFFLATCFFVPECFLTEDPAAACFFLVDFFFAAFFFREVVLEDVFFPVVGFPSEKILSQPVTNFFEAPV